MLPQTCSGDTTKKTPMPPVPFTPLPMVCDNMMDKSTVRSPPEPPPPATRISFPSPCARKIVPTHWTQLVEYRIPIEKARANTNEDAEFCIPPGSLADPTILVRPASPTTPFEVPFPRGTKTQWEDGALGVNPTTNPLRHESVTRVVGLMRMCGLDSMTDVCMKLSRVAGAAPLTRTPTLLDGGATICLTGVLELLVDVESIAPLPILVTTIGGSVSTDDCCTKKGLLLLTLDDSIMYYQPCFYCKNAVETIVSPQAILAASEVLVCWTQTGHKDGSPGKVRFESESGLLSFTITLENRDGLYYCPTDVFTVKGDPSRGSSRKICRTSLDPPPIQRRHKSYEPVLLDRITESKLWMLCLGSLGEDQLGLLPGNVTGIPNKFDYHPF
jgi:hypothetical protein